MTVREDFLFSWRDAQGKKRHISHIHLNMYKYAHYEPVLVSASTQKHTPPFLLIQRIKHCSAYVCVLFPLSTQKSPAR